MAAVLQDSAGGMETSTYNAGNLLTNRQFTGNSATLRFDYTYNSLNEATQMTRYSALNATGTIGWTSFAYDTRGRLTNLQHRDSSNTSLSNTTFAYDNFDRLTVKTVNGTATMYSYCGSRNQNPENAHIFSVPGRREKGATASTRNSRPVRRSTSRGFPA
jgi:YD repeat-containing protein